MLAKLAKLALTIATAITTAPAIAGVVTLYTTGGVYTATGQTSLVTAADEGRFAVLNASITSAPPYLPRVKGFYGYSGTVSIGATTLQFSDCALLESSVGERLTAIMSFSLMCWTQTGKL